MNSVKYDLLLLGAGSEQWKIDLKIDNHSQGVQIATGFALQ